MLEVKYGPAKEKIAVFRHVDSGEVIEKDFMSANITPPSKAHKFLSDAGLCDAKGGVDVNKYTLQHNKHENIFAFGDCISGDTTRTQVAAQGQVDIVKNNMV
jgi:NADPH-dependent 2,4-dienoyl-CoA reductase/sulfur reductase-like enzyme